MTDDEVEVVAAELAKAGGVSWYPGREKGPLKVISDRYRDRARLAIAVLDRHRAARAGAAPAEADPPEATSNGRMPAPTRAIQVGTSLLYRPPGDLRAYPCRVEQVEGNRVYLVPDIKSCTGWVDMGVLLAHSSPHK